MNDFYLKFPSSSSCSVVSAQIDRQSKYSPTHREPLICWWRSCILQVDLPSGHEESSLFMVTQHFISGFGIFISYFFSWEYSLWSVHSLGDLLTHFSPQANNEWFSNDEKLHREREEITRCELRVQVESQRDFCMRLVWVSCMSLLYETFVPSFDSQQFFSLDYLPQSRLCV